MTRREQRHFPLFTSKQIFLGENECVNVWGYLVLTSPQAQSQVDSFIASHPQGNETFEYASSNLPTKNLCRRWFRFCYLLNGFDVNNFTCRLTSFANRSRQDALATRQTCIISFSD